MIISTRRILTLMLTTVLLFSASAALASAPDPFLPEDMKVDSLYAGASQEEVRSLLGEPDHTTGAASAATGETGTTWFYDTISFTISSTGSLVGATWTDPAYTGPRGIKVGDTAQTVLNAFPRDTISGDDVILYSEGYVPELSAYLPPCGIIIRLSRGDYFIEYLTPMEPYGDDVLASPADYVYQSHASILFCCDRNDMVTSIGWAEGPLAE